MNENENVEKAEKVEKVAKKVSWNYNTVGKLLTVTFPSGKTHSFNLSARVNGMAYSDELIFQYGFRQWVSSNAASIATTDEDAKLESFKADYTGFVEKGLTLSENGTVISIVGKERANAGASTENAMIAKTVKSARSSMNVDQIRALKTLGFTLTPEEEALIAEPKVEEVVNQ